MQNRVSVYSTRDKMKAFVMVSKQHEDDFPEVKEIISVLEKYGVVFGVDTEKIRDFADEKKCDSKVEVAFGKPVIPGSAGQLEFLVELRDVGKPKMLPNGRVDHMELKKLINVRKDQPLVRRIPPVIGEDGITVLGISVKASVPEDVIIKVGTGTKLHEEDENLLVASNDGALIIDSGGLIEVKTSRTITSDIDYSTGNITFSGDLKINGTVRRGFSVSVEGNLQITGSLEDAIVHSDSDIVIQGGASGKNKGNISCHGSLKVKHLENFKVKTHHDLNVQGTVLHSEVYSGGLISAGSVIGGKIRVTHGMKVGELGTESGVKTVVMIGHDDHILQLKIELAEEIEALTATIDYKKENLYSIVSERMNDQGVLEVKDEQILDEIKNDIRILDVKFRDLEKKLEKVIHKIENMPKPQIHASVINSNTVFCYGKKEMVISSKMHDKTVTINEGMIKI